MGYTISELVNPVNRLDQLLWGSVEVREGGVQRIVPEALPPRIAIGKEEPPRTERQLSQKVGVCEWSTLPTDCALGTSPRFGEFLWADESPKQGCRIEQPVAIGAENEVIGAG